MNQSNQSLPVEAVLVELEGALAARRAAVLVAPPGAGKTTRVPPALLAAPWLMGRSILMLEPRRLAARAAAYRMAHEAGEEVGATVGYRVRLDSRVGPRTRIEVLTEGVLTRRLQSDPGLAGVGLVIFDEFHERHLESDLGLALCREIQGVLNADLRLLVMSATLEAEPVAALLGEVPVIRARGQSFPVETHHIPPRPEGPLERDVVQAIALAAGRHPGDILVFLPGAAEIRRVLRRLEGGPLGPEWIVAPLLGQLSREEQDRAIAVAPAGRRKVVLATAIAETSLTIEGVRVVVDSGRMRVPRFDVAGGLTRLVTLPVTRAAADQRRGRAGRTAPGVCYRLWSAAAHAGLRDQGSPEILEADLAPLALELAAWGVKEAAHLAWLNPPPAAALAQARELLVQLGALEASGHVTAHGRAMAELPLHPRLAHMLLAAKAECVGAAACDLAALIGEREVLRFPPGEPDADLRLRLEALEHLRSGGRFPEELALDRPAARRVLRVAEMLRRRLGVAAAGGGETPAGRLLAWAYPDRIAQRRPEALGRFRLANGRGAVLDPAEALAGEGYLVAAELDGDRREARIFRAAATDAATLEKQFSACLEWSTFVAWDPVRGSVRAERHLRLGALVLRSAPLADPHPEALREALLEGIRRVGLTCLPWTRGLRAWQARVGFLGRFFADEGWPDLSDAALGAGLATWLGPHLGGMQRLRDLARLDLAAILRGCLTWPQARQLEELAPTHFQVPSGSHIPIDYGQDAPVLAVRLQELFGATRTPAVAGGRQPLLLHLLSPAGRPVQVTQDLAGFWRSGYLEVKKALKGRYPRHHWPDDPLAAAPTARAKPRRH
jgi:ATP-dependent helicase HrpB